MKAEPLKGKLQWTVSKNILRNLLHAEIDSHIAFMKKDDIRSAVEWLKEEMKFWFGTETNPTLLEIQIKIEKAFEDVIKNEK